jgi:hypothetical protein
MMLTRRLNPRLVPSLSRLSSTHRTPALADITEDGVESFKAKQREFRERLVAESEAQKRKEQAESMSAASNVTDSDSTPSKSSVLGSLSSQFAEEARARELDGGRKKGALSSLIYGTAEGRELDKDIERSFSQVLARGKYVHSIVFHNVKPDKVDEYVDLVGKWYPKMASMPENKVNLVGSWRTEVGDCDTFGEFTRFQCTSDEIKHMYLLLDILENLSADQVLALLEISTISSEFYKSSYY